MIVLRIKINIINIFCLFLLSQITLSQNNCSGTVDYSINFAINGDFQQPSLIWQSFMIINNSINGWEFRQMELGRGSIYNSGWTSQVIQLDVSRNQMFNQTLNMTSGTYMLEFQCAARQGAPLSTSGFSAYWNDVLLITQYPPTNYSINTYQFTITAAQGPNKLTLQGKGISTNSSTAVGQSCDNVKFFKYSVSYNRQVVAGLCECSIGFFDNYVDQACVSCSQVDQYCIKCQNLTNGGDPAAYSNQGFNCLQCSTGYVLNNSICELTTPPPPPPPTPTNQTCGNGNLEGTEQCDDGNSLNSDGCSLLCIVEVNFICTSVNNNMSQLTSKCLYTGNIYLNIIDIQKSDSANQINIVINYGPKDMPLWGTVDLAKMVVLSNMTNFGYYQVVQNQDGTCIIVANYNTDIQGMNVTVEFDPALSGQPLLGIVAPVKKNFLVETSDNEATLFYDSETYELAKSIGIFASIIGYSYMVLFVIGLFSVKLIGVQSMAVIQISYLSLMTLRAVNPTFKALTAIWFVNGPNYFNIILRSLTNIPIPMQLKAANLYVTLVQNYNLTSVLILGTLLCALVLFLLSRANYELQSTKQNLTSYSKRCIGEFTFTMIMFSAYIVFTGFVINFQYSILGQEEKNMVAVIGLAVGITFFLIFILYFLLLIKSQGIFGEFVSFFQDKKISNQNINQDQKLGVELPKLSQSERQNFKMIEKQQRCKVSKKFYNLMMLERIIVASGLALMFKTQFACAFIIAIFFVIMMAVVIRRPFQRTIHNIRFVCNMVITISIQAIYLAYRLTPTSEQINKKIWVFLPLIVCILLGACFAYNTVCLIYEIVMSFKSADKKYKIEQDSKIGGEHFNNIVITENYLAQNEQDRDQAHQEKKNKKQFSKKQELMSYKRDLKLKDEMPQQSRNGKNI